MMPTGKPEAWRKAGNCYSLITIVPAIRYSACIFMGPSTPLLPEGGFTLFARVAGGTE